MPEAPIWVSVAQTVGVAGGLFFAGLNIARDVKQKKIANYLELTKGQRDIWKEALKDNSLLRVSEPSPDLEQKPITEQERIFVRFVIFHANCAFMLMKADLSVRVEGLREDVIEFLQSPIPKSVWLDMKQFQNKDFVAFIDHGVMPKRWFMLSFKRPRFGSG